MGPLELTWAGVVARRLERQALAEPATDLDPAGVASLLCGVHAQVLGAAELAIGRRIAGATRSDVQRALWEDRTLVKTFGPRGTVHLLATADLPDVDRRALGPAVVRAAASRARPVHAPTRPTR